MVLVCASSPVQCVIIRIVVGSIAGSVATAPGAGEPADGALLAPAPGTHAATARPVVASALILRNPLLLSCEPSQTTVDDRSWLPIVSLLALSATKQRESHFGPRGVMFRPNGIVVRLGDWSTDCQATVRPLSDVSPQSSRPLNPACRARRARRSAVQAGRRSDEPASADVQRGRDAGLARAATSGHEGNARLRRGAPADGTPAHRTAAHG